MSRKVSVLFVDDEPNILKAVRRHVRRYRDQWDMHFAFGGVDAVKVITRETIDIVVTDMRMPEVDGSQLLEFISDHHPEMIRIVLSGEAKLDEIYRIVGRSHRFLAKPCAPDAIVSVITDVVDAQLRDQLENGEFNLSMLDNLGTCESVFEKWQAEADREDPDIEALTEIIRKDPSLSLRVLQLANSAYFKSALKTCSVRKAVSHIGIDRLRELFRSGRLGQESKSSAENGALAEEAFWLARACRNHCSTLTEEKDTLSAAYVAGLCLRCGAVDTTGSLSQIARRAAFLTVLLGLPDTLNDALRRLGASNANVPFEQWPRLVAEAFSPTGLYGIEGEVAA